MIENALDYFCGTWASFEDYAMDYVEQATDAQPDTLERRYFDHDAFACDLAFDYGIFETPYGVAIFNV